MSEDKIKKQKQSKDKEANYKPRIRIKIKSYDHRVIDEALKDIIEAASRSGAKIIGPIFLPTEKKKYTVLRSTFVHKNAQDQYEKRVHKRLLDIFDFNPQTLEILTGLHLPAGVDVEIKM
jgi:small subunit ribosomal protein S10